jgi:hypothetical protein
MLLIVLWVSIIVCAVLGVWLFLIPAGWLLPVEVHVDIPTPRGKARARHGDPEIVIAWFLAWCAVEPARVRAWLATSALLVAALGAARLLSILL